MYLPADLLPLSALQHLAFCERQWGLIHIEQAWSENRFTAEGKVLHEKTDHGPDETKHGTRIVRSLAIRSLRLGLSGIADVVEFPKAAKSPPLPVEYKRGKPKSGQWDEIQLCAQALCLEEMLQIPIPAGALYYGQPRRRTLVDFTPQLRTATEQTAARMHELYRAAKTPPPVYERAKCRACSLIEICQPMLPQRKTAAAYLEAAIAESLLPDPE